MWEAANEMSHFRVPWSGKRLVGWYFVLWLSFGSWGLIKPAAALGFLSLVVFLEASSLIYLKKKNVFKLSVFLAITMLCLALPNIAMRQQKKPPQHFNYYGQSNVKCDAWHLSFSQNEKKGVENGDESIDFVWLRDSDSLWQWRRIVSYAYAHSHLHVHSAYKKEKNKSVPKGSAADLFTQVSSVVILLHEFLITSRQYGLRCVSTTFVFCRFVFSFVCLCVLVTMLSWVPKVYGWWIDS